MVIADHCPDRLSGSGGSRDCPCEAWPSAAADSLRRAAAARRIGGGPVDRKWGSILIVTAAVGSSTFSASRRAVRDSLVSPSRRDDGLRRNYALPHRATTRADRALTGEFSGSFPVARRVTACLVFRGVRCRLIGPSRSKFSGLFPVASARHACVGFRVVRRRRIGLSRGTFSGLFQVASARHCVCRLPRTSNRRCRTVSIPIAKMLRTKVADRCRERSTYPP